MMSGHCVLQLDWDYHVEGSSVSEDASCLLLDGIELVNKKKRFLVFERHESAATPSLMLHFTLRVGGSLGEE